MANELSIRATPNKTGYFFLWRQSDSETYIAAGGSSPGWESETIAHWNASPSWYAIAAVEDDHANGGTGKYRASMPGGLAAGVYNYNFFIQAGGSPANTDPP